MNDQAVSDTGPLRHLAEIGEHPILAFFTSILVPQLVVSELESQGFWETLIRDLPQLVIVAGPAIDSELVLLRHGDLHLADSAVLSVAAEYPAHVVLTDDLALRRTAKMRGCRVVGTIGVVGRAYEVGALSLAEAENMLNRLVDESTLYLTQGVLEQIRNAMKRIPPPQ